MAQPRLTLVTDYSEIGNPPMSASDAATAWSDLAFFAQYGAQADLSTARALLARVRDAPPQPGDEISPALSPPFTPPPKNPA